MIEFDPVDKSIGGIIGLIIGFFLGGFAMFKKLSNTDATLEAHGAAIHDIQKTYIPRNETIALYKEYREEIRSEIKDLHHDMADKLDMINTTLTDIKVGLASKVDKK